MKALELKERLTVAVGSIYCIKGEDNFLRRYALEQLINLIPVEEREFCYTVFEEHIDLVSAIISCDTQSLTGGLRIVEVRDANDELTEKQKKALIEYAKKPTDNCVLIFNNCHASYECIEDYVVNVICDALQEYELIKYISELGKDVKIDLSRDMVRLLAQNTGGDLGVITQEVKKMIAFFGSDKIIDVEDGRPLICASLEAKIFELTKALQNGNKNEAFAIYRLLLAGGEKHNVIFATLLNFYHKIFQIAITNADDATIMRVMKIKPYPLTLFRKSIEAGKKVSRSYVPNLKKTVDLLSDLEYKFKSGEITQEGALELSFSWLIAQ